MREKDAVPYIVGGTKITLGVLSKVASLASPPCVQMLITAASQVITIVECVKANRQDSKALAGQLLALLTVISEAYKDQQDEDLAPDIRTSLNRLKCQLDEILIGISKMRLATDPRGVKGFFTGILLHGDNGSKIREYTNSIDWAMNVEGRIGDSLRLLEVAEDTRQVRVVVQDTHKEVVAIRREIADMAIKASKSAMDILPPSPIIPSRSPVLYGREGEIDDIARRIIATESPRYVIHGPGGIGKTALSLGVMEHMEIIQKYGESRHFVQCEQAASSALLIELIARGLRIEQSSHNRMKDVMSRLRSTKQPIFLILDNFETPWDIVGEQSRVEAILCQITSLPHVAILLTMRSDAPPSAHVRWSLPRLDSLHVLQLEAARALYINVDPKAGGDSSLDTLLADLSYMPLAITLMASLGRSGQRPTALLEAWRDKSGGTDLFRGTDKNKSVNISIQLSIESNLMKSVPEALTLLSLIAMLPAGADAELLPLLAKDIPNLPLAQATLSGATLTYVDGDTHAIRLLSPVRSYVLKHYPASDNIKLTIYDTYAQFITKHNSALGDKSFLSDARVLTAEETNLEAILPLSLQSGSRSAIEAATDFSRYQRWTRPRLEVITCAVDVCRRNGNLDLLASSLLVQGEMFYYLGQHNEAQVAKEQARDMYEELGDRRGVADCLKGLGDIHWTQGRHAEAQAVYEQACRMYKDLDARRGVANCLSGLGDIHCAQGRHAVAQAIYEQASKIYGDLGDRYGVANCLSGLGDVHRIQGRRVDAQAAYEQASTVYEELGVRRGLANCLSGLGTLYRIQGRYEESEAVYERASSVYGELGDQLGSANCLVGLGEVHRRQARYNDALKEFSAAKIMYEELGYQVWIKHCSKRLDSINSRIGIALS
ncbi:hypothetical protein FRB96_005749 [Tulasnella sp. 330]|nr:hypothetical protein FRB96_005749 [Tulasnella sp. 330]KAG8881152.1 hypothetical protein FRB97_009848 [Tulasnella sp. 331]